MAAVPNPVDATSGEAGNAGGMAPRPVQQPLQGSQPKGTTLSGGPMGARPERKKPFGPKAGGPLRVGSAGSESDEESGDPLAGESPKSGSTGAPTTGSLRAELPPKPTRRDRISEDLEREIEAALGDQSLDSLLTGGVVPTSTEKLQAESRRRAQVIRIHGDNVFFSLDGRHEGVVSIRQFRTPPQLGDTMDVVVKSINEEDGLCELMVPGASVEVADWGDLSDGAVVEAKVTAANSGGLECEVNRIRGFIPASQIGLYRVENLPDYVGQKLLCVVTEANPQRRNLVLSHRAVLEREKAASRQEFYAGLEVGQTREGTVRKIHDFGAFVDLGGADGLIHISQLSWERVKHPSEIVQEGQKVQVRIEKVDPDTGKISLSYRSLQDHPWTNAAQQFPVNSMVHGVVSRIANFGAFVKLGPGIEGLIHITELAHYRVSNISKVLREGQEVDVKVLSVDPDAQRIALSLKAALPAPEAKEEPEAPDEPPRPLVVPKRSGPLKGGVDRSNGGDQFGLRW